AVGLKYNVPLEDELKNPELQDINAGMFMKFRDKYLEVMGTTLCPELQKQIYGRSFIFTDPADCEEYWKIEDHAEKCAVVVEKATRMIAEFLLDNEKAE
ncbi:MAG: C-GCAxxG-C-C family protein, partial [Oscillospiraceae bacterium]|nr:C-GCAxxG-C-C family protein [Oscillospiraceae bacterium]